MPLSSVIKIPAAWCVACFIDLYISSSNNVANGNVQTDYLDRFKSFGANRNITSTIQKCVLSALVRASQ